MLSLLCQEVQHCLIGTTHQIEGVPHFLGGQYEAGDEVGQEPGDSQRGLDDALQVEPEIFEQDFAGTVVIRAVSEILDNAAVCRVDTCDVVDVTDVVDDVSDDDDDDVAAVADRNVHHGDHSSTPLIS